MSVYRFLTPGNLNRKENRPTEKFEIWREVKYKQYLATENTFLYLTENIIFFILKNCASSREVFFS